MVEKEIVLENTEDIKLLCQAANTLEHITINILSGDYIIDAKSFMGIFALKNREKLRLCIDAEEAQLQDFWEQIAMLLR